MTRRFRLAVVALLVTLATPAGLAPPPAPAHAQLFNLESVGREEHPKILQQFGGEYPDPAVRAYVRSIGNRLLRQTEMAGEDFTFTVLNSEIVNAFALPGGYVYVTRGLMTLANSEAELAGVMAHEIGHVTGRHAESRMQKGLLAQLGLGILGAVVDSGFITNLLQFGTAAVLQSYSREQEFEADTLGVRYMTAAGYDPYAMARFLANMKAEQDLSARMAGAPEGESNQFNILSTHPRTAERVERAIAHVGADVDPAPDPRVGVGAYMGAIRGMYYGGDPDNGFIKGRRFVHPELGFTFSVPPEFSIINNPDVVLAVGPGNAQIVFDFAKRPAGASMLRYVRDVWGRQLRLSALEPITVNGLDAATGATRLDTQQGQMDVRLVAIAHGEGRIARFLFVTPPQLTGELQTELQRTTFSYRRLSPAQAREERPYVIRTAQVEPGQTVATFAERMPFPDFREDRFRVLNGLPPQEQLQPGWWVKYVGE